MWISRLPIPSHAFRTPVASRMGATTTTTAIYGRHSYSIGLQLMNKPLQRHNLKTPPASLSTFLRMSTSSSSSSSSHDSFLSMDSEIIQDGSAITKARRPFRMPKGSPDDSKAPRLSKDGIETANSLTWTKLGLLPELVECVQDQLKLPDPTPVQSLAIPQILKRKTDSMAFLAATGSGKTLAYLLPLMQQLKEQELLQNYERRSRRPRLLVLAPTRELALQITHVMKSLSHSIKVSSQALVGGQDKGSQRKAVSGRPVDVVVATPGRLLQHWKDGTVFLGSVESIVLDEMDTMLEQGFQRELRSILYPLLYAQPPKDSTQEAKKSNTQPNLLPLKDNAPRIILTSATMTQSIQRLLGDNPKTSTLSVNAKRLHMGRTNSTKEELDSKYIKLQLPPMSILTAPGLHKTVPRLEHTFVDIGNADKITMLIDTLASKRYDYQKGATIVFCNTAASVQAVQYALAEARIETLAYHGELNSAARAENLRKFRQGAAAAATRATAVKSNSHDYYDDDEFKSLPNVLVCTDLAARGLDIPEVDHIIMFDFPLNAMDYLHRSGRTARGAGRGRVTALVAKRDKVLATAIERAVIRGDPLDGLSSNKSDYLPGGKLGVPRKKVSTSRRDSMSNSKRRMIPGSGRSFEKHQASKSAVRAGSGTKGKPLRGTPGKTKLRMSTTEKAFDKKRTLQASNDRNGRFTGKRGLKSSKGPLRKRR